MSINRNEKQIVRSAVKSRIPLGKPNDHQVLHQQIVSTYFTFLLKQLLKKTLLLKCTGTVYIQQTKLCKYFHSNFLNVFFFEW